MYGIAAEHGRPDLAAGGRMLLRLAHRGPDDQGSVRINGSWLGHRRLSIVDVSGGAQPLANEAGDLWLVGNGEVYNHERIRGVRRPAPRRAALAREGTVRRRQRGGERAEATRGAGNLRG